MVARRQFEITVIITNSYNISDYKITSIAISSYNILDLKLQALEQHSYNISYYNIVQLEVDRLGVDRRRRSSSNARTSVA
jgi:hypothetical protein